MAFRNRRRRAAEQWDFEEEVEGRNFDAQNEHSNDSEAESGGQQSKGTLRLDLDRFSDFARGLPVDWPERLSDAPVYIRGMSWRILAIPREGGRLYNRNRTSTKCLGFFVQCNDDAGAYQNNWSCLATARLRIVSQHPDVEDLQRTIQHTFHPKQNDWGYSQFVPCEVLLDETAGFIQDDVVRLEVDVSADVVHGFQSPRPTHGKKTVHRFELKDFWNRFAEASFGDRWESGDFAVRGVPDAAFFLRFCPKGSDEEWADGCGLFLCVRDFGGHPFVRLQFTCWFEDEEKHRFNLREDEHKFHASSDERGWTQIIEQEELARFAQSEPLFACCEVRPVDPIDAVEWAQRTGPAVVCRKIAANFDAAEFADVEVHVQGRVFNVNKMIVCSGSPVFRNMFTHDSAEKQTGIVEIKKEDADLIELLLRFFYLGQVEGLAEVAHRLLPVADCYEVPELAELCLKSLQAQLSVSTILRDLQLTFRHDHHGGFKRKFLAFAHKNLKAVDEHPDWTPQFVSENPEIAMAMLKQCSH